MANNVTSHIDLGNANEAATEYFTTFCRLMGEDQWKAFDFLFGESEKTHSWMIDNIGAKWLIVEDAEDDYMNLCTAWSWPLDLFNELHEKLFELDENIEIFASFEDEMPNFVGWKAYKGDDEESEIYHCDDFGMIIEGWKTIEELEEEDEDEDIVWEKWDEQMSMFWEELSDYVNKQRLEFFGE